MSVTRCCCCFTLKTGIILIGVWEIFWFLIEILSMAVSAYIGFNLAYNILPIFIKPFVVDLPKILVFLILACSGFRPSIRSCNYYVRAYSLAMLILCSLAQVISSWLIITNDYKPEYCNARGDKNTEADYRRY